MVTEVDMGFQQITKLSVDAVKGGIGDDIFSSYPVLINMQDAVSPLVFTNDNDYIAQVRQGVPGVVIKKLAQNKRMNLRHVLVDVLGTGENLSRTYRGKLNAQRSENVLHSLKVINEAVRIFGNEEKAEMWLSTKIRALGGQKPYDLFDTHKGRELVSNALATIEDGEFT